MLAVAGVVENGDVANKTGTSGVAILTRHSGFYVFGSSSTIASRAKPKKISRLSYAVPMKSKQGFILAHAPEEVEWYNPPLIS